MRPLFALSLLISAAACQTATPTAPAPTSLSAAGALSGRLVGTEVEAKLLGQDPAYTAVVKREFSVLVPENEMKFGRVSKARGIYDFTDADRIVQFAKDNGMKVRGHTLAWHRNLPKWLTGGKFNGAELKGILLAHIAAEVGHFRGRVISWDVVNEALDNQGKPRPETIWAAIGSAPLDYVALAFRAAHAADPAAELFYNDYSIEEVGPKSDGVYALVKDLRAEGVPINGVGFQFHIDEGNTPNFDSVGRNFARFAALGVKIHVTELDDGLKMPPDTDTLAAQARTYGAVASACRAERACEALLSWGFTDAHSWIPEFSRGKRGAALYFDENYRPKPAYAALLAALAGER